MGNITLIGMPGSGKSTVGVLLAKFLGYGFLDVDLVIQRQEGALLQDIIDRRGVAAFLDAEEQAVLGLSCDKHVIAPGGSAEIVGDKAENAVGIDDGSHSFVRSMGTEQEKIGEKYCKQSLHRK